MGENSAAITSNNKQANVESTIFCIASRADKFNIKVEIIDVTARYIENFLRNFKAG